MSKEAFIKLKNVSKLYTKKSLFGKVQAHQAVDGVNLTLYKGETLGLVGESGSGKTTLSKLILGLESLSSGQITYPGLTEVKQQQAMQIIYQDPFSALNPYLSALDIVKESLYRLDKEEATKQALAMLDRVGIKGADVHKRPTSFSGGQRQRIGIARAVVSHPQFIVCDEPTSALDVSIQAQILTLLAELQKELHLSYLFISHDLTVVEHFSDRIAVLYQGKLVELAPAKELFKNAQHPYTHYLLKANLPISPREAKAQLAQLSSQLEDFPMTEAYEWVEVGPDHFFRKNKD